MKVQETPLDRIKPYPNNPRVNDQAVQGVADSIQAFGFQQPIVVDKDGVIIVGHTRYKAAQQLGLAKVPVVVADGLTPDEVAAYRLADNKTAERSIWDTLKLDVELKGIELDMSPWFEGQAWDGVSADDFGDTFSLPDNDQPGMKTMTLRLTTDQYETITGAVDGMDRSECVLAGGNIYGDKICEAVRQWAGL